jgi:hypothetical protein
MGQWYRKKMTIPTTWKLINNDRIEARYAFNVESPNKDYYILHYFQADCDKCVYFLSKASESIKNNKGQYPNLRYVFVGTGTSSHFIEEALKKIDFPFPLYFEEDFNKFRILNNLPIDEDGLYNTMLLNIKNELLLFGSYYDNDKAQKLFTSIINCKQ